MNKKLVILSLVTLGVAAAYLLKGKKKEKETIYNVIEIKKYDDRDEFLV